MTDSAEKGTGIQTSSDTTWLIPSFIKSVGRPVENLVEFRLKKCIIQTTPNPKVTKVRSKQG